MRTNIDIDDQLMDAAMRAGPFKTKKDAVEAGLRLLSRQAAYREILKWEGKLQWSGDEEDEVAELPQVPLRAEPSPAPLAVNQVPARFGAAASAGQPGERETPQEPVGAAKSKAGHGRR